MSGRQGLLAVAAFLAAGCSSAPAGPDATTSSVVLRTERGPRRPDLDASFQVLAAAVAARDDGLARVLLRRVLAQGPEGAALERALAYGRILDGRAHVDSLSLVLDVEPVEGDAPDLHRVVLRAAHDGEAELRLRLLPGTLERRRTGLDLSGVQRNELDTRLVGTLTDLVLPPGEVVVRELCRYVPGAGNQLAVRERWSLRLRSGVVRVGEADLPAAEVPVETCERLHLATWIPAGEVAPAELAAALGSEQELPPPAFLAQAVRVPPAEEQAALAALASVVERLSRDDPDRVLRVTPALRWLARTRAPGTDARRWARHLRDGGADRGAPEEARPRLDLPESSEEPESPRRGGRR